MRKELEEDEVKTFFGGGRKDHAPITNMRELYRAGIREDRSEEDNQGRINKEHASTVQSLDEPDKPNANRFERDTNKQR